MKNTQNILLIFILLGFISLSAQNFSARKDFSTLGSPQNIASGDINGDGKPDMVIANSTKSFSVFINETGSSDALPTFSEKHNFSTGNVFSNSVVVCDFNGDGKLDVGTIGRNTGTLYGNLSVFLNTTTNGASTPTFSSQTDFVSKALTNDIPIAIATSDFNNDGKPDVVIVDLDSDQAPNYPSSISILLNTTAKNASTPTFSDYEAYATSNYSKVVSIADINGDSKPDIAVANFQYNFVSIFLNNIENGATTLTQASLSPKVDLPSYGPEYLTFGDINGDMKSDLVVTSYNNPKLTIYMNTTTSLGSSTPQFADAIDYSLSTNQAASSVEFSDVDSDGKEDMIITLYDGVVEVCKNTTSIGAASPSFDFPLIFHVGIWPYHPQLVDFNGDSKKDIAVLNTKSDSFTVLLNGGSIPSISFPYFVSFSDLIGWSASGTDMWTSISHFPDNTGTVTSSVVNPSSDVGDVSLIANFFNLSSGTQQYFKSPILDFSGLTNPVLSFYVAYRSYLERNDGLNVVVSTDGGATFSSPLYSKSENSSPSLSTLPNSSTFYIPGAASEWRHESVDLSAYAGNNSVMVAFSGVSAYGNNCWIDNFSIIDANSFSSQTVSATGTYTSGDISVNMTQIGNADGKMKISRINSAPSSFATNQFLANASATTQDGSTFTPTGVSSGGYFVITYDYNSSAIYDINIDISNYSGLTDASKLYIVKRTDEYSPWVSLPTTLSGDILSSASISGFSQFGIAGDFSTTAPAAVTLLSPYNNAFNQSINSVTLSWNFLSDASGYQVQVSTVSDFSSTVYDQSPSANYTNVSGLSASTTYYWRVRGTNTAGTGVYSSVFQFTTRAYMDNALSFDGTDDYVDCGDVLGALSDFTIESWIFYDGSGNGWFISYTDGTYNNRLQVEVYSGKIYFGWQNGASFSSLNGGTISNNTWYHVAVTSSSTSGKQIYVNGSLVASDANTISPANLSGTKKLTIGRLYNTTNANYFSGKIDEVRIWNTIRTESEIMDNKNNTSLSPSTSGLVAYYNFDQGTADGTNTGVTTLTNVISSGLNGTLTNFALTGSSSNWVSSNKGSITPTGVGMAITVFPNVNFGLGSQSGTINASVELVSSAPPNMPSGSRTIGKYWDITSVSGPTKIRLYYTATDKTSFTGTPKIYHYTGGAWVELPTDPEVGPVSSLYYVQTTNFYSSFSPVTVGDSDAPLPVELTSFTATVNDNSVNLIWQTATEVNNYGFEIERSNPPLNPLQGGEGAERQEWVAIAFIEGSGNSNSLKEYSFVNESLQNGKYSYRLKQIDFDGKFEYSNEIEVEVNMLPSEFALFQNYPNPFNPSTTIKYNLPVDSKVVMEIHNILGERVMTLINQEIKAGFNEVNFNASDLSSGVYIYRLITSSGFTMTKKLMLLK